jgi:hypothetical protein
MIGVFEERRTTVRALQLRPDTLAELLRWTLGSELTADRWIPAEHCWRVSAQRWYLDDGAPYMFHAGGTLFVGIRTRDGERVVVDGDWVVQPSGSGGGFRIVSADRFTDLYQALPAEGRGR